MSPARNSRYSGSISVMLALIVLGFLMFTLPKPSAAQNPSATTSRTPITVTPSPVGTLTATPTFIPANSQTPDVPDAGIGFPYFAPTETPMLNFVGAAFVPEVLTYELFLSPYNNKHQHTGAVWAKSKQVVSGGFELTFKFRMYTPEDGGADGFAFVMQNASNQAIGTGGCGLGYEGIPHSLIIEFDTYHNDTLCADTHDPSDNHIGIMFNGDNTHHDPALVLDIPKDKVNFHDGQPHHVLVLYYVESTPSINIQIDGGYQWDQVPDSLQWRVPIDPSKVEADAEGRMWVGFTAGTYLERQNHNLLEWEFFPFGSYMPPTVTPSTTPTQAPTQPLTPTPTRTVFP